jgi:hypothetical protein
MRVLHEFHRQPGLREITFVPAFDEKAPLVLEVLNMDYGKARKSCGHNTSFHCLPDHP